MQNVNYDVVIIGASFVGASCAIALHQLGLKVVVIDAKSISIDTEPLDSRVYAISVNNVAWLKALNVWQRSDETRNNNIEKMHLWSDAGRELVLDAFEVNALSLGTIVENNQLLSAMHAQLDTLGVELVTGLVINIDYAPDAAVLQGDFGEIQTQLVVAADGANSWTRTNAGISITMHDYEHQGVVANFRATKSHQHVARQWFKGSSVLAFLPMAHDVFSMVWSTDNQHAAYLLGLDATELANEVANACDHLLGELQLVTPATAYPLQAQQAERLVADRLVLIGDAAHTLHPLAGQGVNLGFRDVIALVSILNAATMKKSFKQIDVPRTLRHYARSRQPDMLLMRFLTHGLQKLFASDAQLVKSVRNQGMAWLQHQTKLKNRMMHQMLDASF